MRIINFFILFIVFNTALYAENKSESGTAFSLFNSKTYVKNPLDLRDPFKKRLNKKKGATAQQKAQEGGLYTNYKDRIEDKPIESIRIVGIVIGKERRAMAKLSQGKDLGSEVYFIKEGMKIGSNGAEVKAILPGGIVLVEKIRNVYDQDEYLETVIPLSNE